MTLLADHEIWSNVLTNNMIFPAIVEKAVAYGISYGLSSYGYDVRLGEEFVVFMETPEPTLPTEIGDHEKFIDNEFIIYPGAFVLAHTLERISLPNDITGLVKDKSTLARRGIAVQNTVLEAGWSGQITLEITNHGPQPIILKAGMGIAQIQFWRGNPCHKPYDGKYMNQTGVVLPR